MGKQAVQGVVRQVLAHTASRIIVPSTLAKLQYAWLIFLEDSLLMQSMPDNHSDSVNRDGFAAAHGHFRPRSAPQP